MRPKNFLEKRLLLMWRPKNSRNHSGSSYTTVWPQSTESPSYPGSLSWGSLSQYIQTLLAQNYIGIIWFRLVRWVCLFFEIDKHIFLWNTIFAPEKVRLECFQLWDSFSSSLSCYDLTTLKQKNLQDLRGSSWTGYYEVLGDDNFHGKFMKCGTIDLSWAEQKLIVIAMILH